MIQKLGTMATDADAQGKLGEYMALLYDQALLSEGSPLPDPNAFAKRVTALMTEAVGAK
jgi:molecular chaperone HtpG